MFHKVVTQKTVTIMIPIGDGPLVVTSTNDAVIMLAARQCGNSLSANRLTDYQVEITAKADAVDGNRLLGAYARKLVAEYKSVLGNGKHTQDTKLNERNRPAYEIHYFHFE